MSKTYRDGELISRSGTDINARLNEPNSNDRALARPHRSTNVPNSSKFGADLDAGMASSQPVLTPEEKHAKTMAHLMESASKIRPEIAERLRGRVRNITGESVESHVDGKGNRTEQSRRSAELQLRGDNSAMQALSKSKARLESELETAMARGDTVKANKYIDALRQNQRAAEYQQSRDAAMAEERQQAEVDAAARTQGEWADSLYEAELKATNRRRSARGLPPLKELNRTAEDYLG